MIQGLKNFFANLSQTYMIDDQNNDGLSSQLIIHHDPMSYIAQQYSQIAGSLLFHNSLKKAQSIVFTSPQPGDGKSTTISNVAISMASNYDQKTLLIDGDWRRPQLGKFFNAKTLKPLNSKEEDYQKYVFKTPIEKLDLWPVNSETIKKLDWLELIQENLSDIKSDYDLVFIDTAPVLKVIDSAIIGRESDAVVMLIRAQDTTGGLAQQAQQILLNNNIPLKASVLVNHPNTVDVYNYLLNPHYRKYYSNYYTYQ